jgi:hypothetical protein
MCSRRAMAVVAAMAIAATAHMTKATRMRCLSCSSSSLLVCTVHEAEVARYDPWMMRGALRFTSPGAGVEGGIG